jgi:hypothetical protein
MSRKAPVKITPPNEKVQAISYNVRGGTGSDMRRVTYLVYPKRVEVWGNFDPLSYISAPFDKTLKPMVTNNFNGKKIKEIFSSNLYSIMLTQDGVLYSTGVNNVGQLGDGSGVNSYTPVPVSNNGVLFGKVIKQVYTGASSVIVVDTNNVIYGWGNLGECYRPSPVTNYAPVQLGDVGGIVTSVVHGDRYTYIQSNDKVFTCGNGTILPATILINKPIRSLNRLHFGFYAMTTDSIILVRVSSTLSRFMEETKLFANEPTSDTSITGTLKLDMFSAMYTIKDVNKLIVWTIGNSSRITIVYNDGVCIYGENELVKTLPDLADLSLTTTRVIVTRNKTVFSNTNNGIQEFQLEGSGMQKVLSVTPTSRGVIGIFATCIETNFVGENCDIPICFGRNATDPYVCNGPASGVCAWPGKCNCTSDYRGEECEILRCGEFYQGEKCDKLSILSIVFVVLGTSLLICIICSVLSIMAFVIFRYRKVVVKQKRAEIEMNHLLQESLIRADSLADRVDRDWVIPFTEIKFMDKLAEGSFGVVMRGRYQSIDV